MNVPGMLIRLQCPQPCEEEDPPHQSNVGGTSAFHCGPKVTERVASPSLSSRLTYFPSIVFFTDQSS